MADVRYFLADLEGRVMRFVFELKGVHDEVLLIAIADVLGETDSNLWKNLLEVDDVGNKDGLWRSTYFRVWDLAEKSIGKEPKNYGEHRPHDWRSSTFTAKDGLEEVSEKSQLARFKDFSRTGKFFDHGRAVSQFLTTATANQWFTSVKGRLQIPAIRSYFSLFLLKLNECSASEKQLPVEELLSLEDLAGALEALGQSTEYGLGEWKLPLKLPKELQEKFPNSCSYKDPSELTSRRAPPSVKSFEVFGRTIERQAIDFAFERKIQCSVARSLKSTQSKSVSSAGRKAGTVARKEQSPPVRQIGESMASSNLDSTDQASVLNSYNSALTNKKDQIAAVSNRRQVLIQEIEDKNKELVEVTELLYNLTSGMEGIQTEGLKCASSIVLANTLATMNGQCSSASELEHPNLVAAKCAAQLNLLLNQDKSAYNKVAQLVQAAAVYHLDAKDLPNIFKVSAQKPSISSSQEQTIAKTSMEKPKPSRKATVNLSSSSSSSSKPRSRSSSQSSKNSSKRSSDGGASKFYNTAKENDDGKTTLPGVIPNRKSTIKPKSRTAFTAPSSEKKLKTRDEQRKTMNVGKFNKAASKVKGTNSSKKKQMSSTSKQVPEVDGNMTEEHPFETAIRKAMTSSNKVGVKRSSKPETGVQKKKKRTIGKTTAEPPMEIPFAAGSATDAVGDCDKEMTTTPSNEIIIRENGGGEQPIVLNPDPLEPTDTERNRDEEVESSVRGLLNEVFSDLNSQQDEENDAASYHVTQDF